MFVLDSGNSTSEREWHPNPTARGTWAIYQSCIVTIGLCVWQSIHLNIPPPQEVWYKQTMRKVGFALMALIAPEFVAFIAWSQYCEAKRIVKAVNESRDITHRRWRTLRRVLGKMSWLLLSPIHLSDRLRMRIFHPDARSDLKSTIKHTSRRNQHGNVEVDSGTAWTTTMGFYAACGGLVGRRDHGVPKVLSTRWIIHIAETEPHLLPILQHDQILDKSKASSLTETITCVQAFWFCASCIARLSNKKAISLLELNTFGHCICTFIIYIFWWHKPYDVTSHTPVDHDICRHEAIVSRFSRNYGHGNCMERNLRGLSRDLAHVVLESPSFRSLEPVCIVRLGSDAKLNNLIHIAEDQMIPGTGFIVDCRYFAARNEDGQASYCLSKEMLALWQELWAIQESIQERCSWPMSKEFYLRIGLGKLLLQQKSNLRKEEHTSLVLTVSGLAFTIYGCIHLLAWFYTFSSTTEQQLWRAATIITITFVPSIAIAFSLLEYVGMLGNKEHKVGYDWRETPSSLRHTLGLVLALKTFFGSFFNGLSLSSLKDHVLKALDSLKHARDMLTGYYYRGSCESAMALLFVLVVLALVLLIAVNVLARSFLLIESFIALPNSPPSVYQSPRWTVYVPHI